MLMMALLWFVVDAVPYLASQAFYFLTRVQIFITVFLLFIFILYYVPLPRSRDYTFLALSYLLIRENAIELREKMLDLFW